MAVWPFSQPWHLPPLALQYFKSLWNLNLLPMGVFSFCLDVLQGALTHLMSWDWKQTAHWITYHYEISMLNYWSDMWWDVCALLISKCTFFEHSCLPWLHPLFVTELFQTFISLVWTFKQWANVSGMQLWAITEVVNNENWAPDRRIPGVSTPKHFCPPPSTVYLLTTTTKEPLSNMGAWGRVSYSGCGAYDGHKGYST